MRPALKHLWRSRRTRHVRLARDKLHGAEETVYQQIDPAITSKFVGYHDLEHDSKITVLTTETELVDALTDGQTGTVIVEETPFYATMGGQKADIGTITVGDSEFVVEDTVHLQGARSVISVRVTKGMIKTGDTATLKVCPGRIVWIPERITVQHIFFRRHSVWYWAIMLSRRDPTWMPRDFVSTSLISLQ